MLSLLKFHDDKISYKRVKFIRLNLSIVMNAREKRFPIPHSLSRNPADLINSTRRRRRRRFSSVVIFERLEWMLSIQLLKSRARARSLKRDRFMNIQMDLRSSRRENNRRSIPPRDESLLNNKSYCWCYRAEGIRNAWLVRLRYTECTTIISRADKFGADKRDNCIYPFSICC